ncbi:MAG: hypothetical protein KDA51_16975 [Planctomycetales bacterium]|nr:hypothetical protein [Planctomycetales bacterium]MCA9183160.1 hypothetical protein [Planctomycetales bacterium]
MLNKVVRCFLFAMLVEYCVAVGQEASIPQGATVAEARAVLDLSGKPVIEASGEATTRVAFQSFKAKGSVLDVSQTIDSKLNSLGLKQLDGASFSDTYGTATYQKSGFIFSLMVAPTSEANITMVTLMNLGNVDLSKLPKPADTKELFVGSTSAIYLSGLPVDEAKQRCRERLEADGWQWFGDTTASFFMRQNAIRLQVMCSAAPAQQGKTAIQFSAEQLSSALPTIADLVRIGYADITMRLDGDSELSEESFLSAYRRTLEAEGWKATTEQPIKIDFRKHLIFRNEANELAELSFSAFEKMTRFDLKFMTAAQVEQEDQRAEERAAQAKLAREAARMKKENPPTISVDKPDTATLSATTKQSLEFSIHSGTARAVVAKWLESRRSAGWTVQSTIDTREIGEFTITKGEQEFDLSFVDPGFIPGEITISTSPNFQLQVNK